MNRVSPTIAPLLRIQARSGIVQAVVLGSVLLLVPSFAAAQTITITGINGVNVTPPAADEVFVPEDLYPVFDVDWQASANAIAVSVFVDGQAVFCDGVCAGTSGTFTLSQPAGGCRHTIRITGSFLIGGTKSSQPAAFWSTPYQGCTGPEGCNRSTVGNPIDVASGKMYLEAVDLTIRGPLPIVFARHYDSQSNFNGAMGYGWQHGYQQRIESAGTGRQVLVDAEQRRVYFNQLPSGGGWDENRIEHLTLAAPGTPAWRVTDKHQTKYEFDGSGNLTKVLDRNGNALTFTYTAGNLTAITDAFGRAVALTYYGTVPDRIHTLSAGSRTVTYTYDGNANLTRVDYPDGSFVTYEYNDPGDIHNLTTARDALGHLIESHDYDGSDRVTHSEADGGNGALDLVYDTTTQSTVTNARGFATVYTFDAFSGLVTSSAGPGCGSCGGGGESTSLVYDAFLNLMERVDGRGIHTQMTYDPKGNTFTRKEAVGTAVERVWRFTYDQTYNLPATIKIASVGTCSNVDRTVTNTYDPTTGDLTQQQITGCEGTAPFTHTTTFMYDLHGQIATVNGPRTDVADVTTYDYFADADADPNRRGRLMTVTNALAQEVNYSGYDLFGNVGSVIDPNLVQTTYVYDARDRVTESRIHGAVPADDLVTINSYDAVGNLDFVKRPLCADAGVACAFSTDYAYDNVHRLTEVQDALGNKVVYTYDTEGNRTREEFRDSLAMVRGFTNFAYDNFNRLQYIYYTSIVPEALGSIFTKFTYDADGNRLTERDPEGHVTSFTYDELNRLGSVTQTAAGSLVTMYSYDRLDGLTSVTDPNSLATTYQNSDMGWRLTTVSPDTGTTTYSYDPAGNLTSSLDANGVTVNRTYDDLSRPLLTSFPDSSLNVTNSYDSGAVSFGIGRRTGMTDASGGSVYHFDRRGLLVKEEKTIAGTTFTTQYGFDKNGNRTQILYPTDHPLRRQGQAIVAYDAADRAVGVTAVVNGAPTTVASGILYEPFGPRTRILFPNGLTDTRTYDSRYQLGTWTLGSLLNYTHVHNNDGNLTSRTDNLNAANNRTFGYDGAHRLTQAAGPWGAGTACPGGVTYTYDLNGNRLCKGEGVATTNYSYTGGTNRLASSTGAEPATYGYDSNGNTTGDGPHTYGYSAADRLSQVDAGSTAAYTHDGEGRRVIKTAAGTTTYYFYDPDGAFLTETIAAEESGKDYLHLDGTPLARVDWTAAELTLGDALRVTPASPDVHLDWSLFPVGDNKYLVRRKLFNDTSQKTFSGNVVIGTVQDPSQVFDDPVLNDANRYLYRIFRRTFAESLLFYHADHLDTPVAMTNVAGALVWRAELLPFGGVHSQAVATVANNLRFPGQYADVETGLYQNTHRWYEARAGRYTQGERGIDVGWQEPDPYAYARLRPTSLSDPLGLFVVEASCDCPALTPFTPPENIPRAIARAGAYLRSPKCQQALARHPTQRACLVQRFGPEEVGAGPHVKCQQNPPTDPGGEACGAFTYRIGLVPATIHLYPGDSACPRFNPSFGIAQTVFHEAIHSCGLEAHDSRFGEIEEACTGWKQ